MKQVFSNSKRLCAVLLVLLMLITLSAPVFAQDVVDGGEPPAAQEQTEEVTPDEPAEEIVEPEQPTEDVVAEEPAEEPVEEEPAVTRTLSPELREYRQSLLASSDIRQMADSTYNKLFVATGVWDPDAWNEETQSYGMYWGYQEDGAMMVFSDDYRWSQYPFIRKVSIDDKIIPESFDDGYFRDESDPFVTIGILPKVRDGLSEGVHKVYIEVMSLSGNVETLEGVFRMKNGVGERTTYDFVHRLYLNCFGRDPDVNGQYYWLNGLWDGSQTGASATAFFFLSDEMERLNITEEEFVRRAYIVLLDRVAEAEGLNYWLGRLLSGNSWAGILYTYTQMPEFADVCEAYDIELGTMNWDVRNGRPDTEVQHRNRSINWTAFVYQMYKAILRPNSAADVEGLNYWCGRMQDGMTPYQLAEYFVHCEEFRNQGHDNESFVLVMYRAFFGREAEPTGKAFWLTKLNSGEMDRRGVFEYFVSSSEFQDILRSFSL